MTFFGGGSAVDRHRASSPPPQIPKKNCEALPPPRSADVRNAEGMPLHARIVIVACLGFSGFSALVYQVLWARWLGFAFGTTTEAIGTVLAVFFAGLALGNLLAARGLPRLRRPLVVYAALELGIGAFALASLPLVEGLGALPEVASGDLAPAARTTLRVLAAAALLLLPTAAMGATLPVVARGLVHDDASLGRASAILYGANTLGAVLGAYLCGFWLIPWLGLSASLQVAAAANLAAAAFAWLAARGAAAIAVTPPPQGERPRRPRGQAEPNPLQPGLLLAGFALSGFIAIGYEILWSKVFGIVMEGTLYGFAAVLTGFLLGIALGSALIAPRIDRLRDPAGVFALLHLAIAISVAAGMHAVPFLPYAFERLAEGGGGVHLAFALVLPLVLVPTALFGAAFPVLIRLYARDAADTGRALGVATAANTAGSIAASLLVSFWCIPQLGMNRTLFGLVLLDLALALVVLAHASLRDRAHRTRALAGCAAVVASVALAFGGVRVDQAIAGRQVGATSLTAYQTELARRADTQTFLSEGRASIVTVYERPASRLLRSNGLPEADFQYAPPYYPISSVLLGAVPALLTESTQRALVIGLGGGNTLRVLLETPLISIDVVELEPSIVEAQSALYRGRTSPLADPRVHLLIDDGRHHLLRGARQAAARYDVIASQPSHPWRVGAANLFTEEFFRLVHARLSEGGCFALWINGFRMDEASLLAVVASFERVFPGSILFDASENGGREDLLLVGGRRPLEANLESIAARLARPALANRLAPYGIRRVEDLLARSEGPTAAFAALAPGAANTDDNAFVETRVPHLRGSLAFGPLENRLAPGTPVLPPLRGAIDIEAVAESLLATASYTHGFPLAPKLSRLLRARGTTLSAARRATLTARGRLFEPALEPRALALLREIAERSSDDPIPLRAIGQHLARARGDFEAAAASFARAFALSHDAADAYDAGRATHRFDAARAWPWFARIPANQRERFPRLALYGAQRALAQHAAPAELIVWRDALLRYRDTEEGRAFPFVAEVLERLARALGDEASARDFAASGNRSSGGPGARALSAARTAHAQGNSAGLEAALRELRFWAPTLRAGIGAENRFRSDHGMPLLPELSLEELAGPRLDPWNRSG